MITEAQQRFAEVVGQALARRWNERYAPPKTEELDDRQSTRSHGKGPKPAADDGEEKAG